MTIAEIKDELQIDIQKTKTAIRNIIGMEISEDACNTLAREMTRVSQRNMLTELQNLDGIKSEHVKSTKVKAMIDKLSKKIII